MVMIPMMMMIPKQGGLGGLVQVPDHVRPEGSPHIASGHRHASSRPCAPPRAFSAPGDTSRPFMAHMTAPRNFPASITPLAAAGLLVAASAIALVGPSEALEAAAGGATALGGQGAAMAASSSASALIESAAAVAQLSGEDAEAARKVTVGVDEYEHVCIPKG
jgi:hypothetical protein